MAHTTLIISDTHLGRPRRATVDMLRPIWEGVDTLIINGDVAEVQMPRLRTRAVEELEKLKRDTQRDGVELQLVSGNHDAHLTDTRHLYLHDRQVLVTHGDALHPSVAPWTDSAKDMARLTKRALEQAKPHERDSLAGRLAIAQHVGHSEFLQEHALSSRGDSNALRALLKPWQIPRVLAYWKQEPALAERFLDRYAPDARFLLLGHSHHAGVWQRGKRTVINTGGFTFPARPWCAMLRNNQLTVERITKSNGVYRRTGQPTARFELQHTDPL